MIMLQKLKHFSENYSHFEWLAKKLDAEYESIGRPISVLDLGAGSASYWHKGKLGSLIHEGKVHLTVLDANPELLNSRTNKNIAYLTGLIPGVLSDFEENQFDWICAFDLIEHLTKEDGYHLLYEIDNIARIGSIIFTPNGFVWQPGSKNNPFNAHISGWTPKELRKLSWDIQRGSVGPKCFFGPYGLRGYQGRSRIISGMILLSWFTVYRVPTLAFSFYAVKLSKNARIENQN